MRSETWRRVRILAVPLLALALAGCAAQMAYRDGRSLVERDQVEQGLVRLREAVERDPGNAQYRATFLMVRDRHATRQVDLAQRELQQGRVAEAKAAFQRALSIDPGHERARQGLRDIEASQRHATLLADATALAAKKDYAIARAKLEAIITEQPGHEGARRLLADIDSQTAPPAVPSRLSAAYRQPVTIEFRDAPLRQVFEVLSRRSGLNFLFDKDVRSDSRTSIFLKNSTVEAAIHYLLTTNQLEQQVMDENTILIYPNVAAKVREYQQMVVKTFYLANADAKTVGNTLKVILKTRDIAIDEKLNMVIVRDSEDAVRLAEKLVALQDVAEAEVMLEVEILEIKRSRLTELGIAWPESLSFAPIVTAATGPLTIDQLRGLNGSRIGVSGVSAAITANKTDADANILANPRIRVRNKEKAKIVIGDKVPVITTTISPGSGGFASESVSYVDVGLTLNVEPTIYLNNEVGIRIALEVSNLVDKQTTSTGTTAYQIGTRQAQTFLQLKDGENQVLAGLINNEERSGGSKVPGVGDLPLVGRLFGVTLDDNQRTEIVLSITPHLVRTVQRPAAGASEFSAGTETSFRRRPDPSERLPVAAPVQPGQVGTIAPAINPNINTGPRVAPPLLPPPAGRQPARPVGVPLPVTQQAGQPSLDAAATPQPEADSNSPNITRPQPLPASRSVVDPPPPPPATTTTTTTTPVVIPPRPPGQ
ncbi:secretin N-terminal domain-containing protein [Pseudoduganella sp. GCM10020061]|uniref:secretin N-terminal domain-containing protein n=1 Tax=Pseudoduganella sp. GCM10020061 TaxID=3317345 RepID=UPI00363F9395